MIPSKIQWLLLSAVVIALDQWSKLGIERWIDRYEVLRVVPGFFNIVHVKNTGIAFGLFPSQGRLFGTMVLAASGLLALTLVAYYFRRTPPSHRLLLAALALVLGGAVGNLLDRVFLGQVTDFLDFYYASRHWWTFNIADTAISCGLGLLLLDSFVASRQESTLSSSDAVDGVGRPRPSA